MQQWQQIPHARGQRVRVRIAFLRFHRGNDSLPEKNVGYRSSPLYTRGDRTGATRCMGDGVRHERVERGWPQALEDALGPTRAAHQESAQDARQDGLRRGLTRVFPTFHT